MCAAVSHINGAGNGEGKWVGIAAGPDGKLYCAPCNASTVLVIDPVALWLRPTAAQRFFTLMIAIGRLRIAWRSGS